ncbi:MAG: hypothetical protein JEY99_20285 [Spirochaetales bacterium]|nr:hypothetical protein [Spirochaetales bacterium]
MIKDKRRTLPIESIREETDLVRTFTFKTDMIVEPGQFVMLTDFKGGEKPFSISDHGDGYLSVTIKKIGDFTSRLFTLKGGEMISIRGSYGSSFFIPGKNRPCGLPHVETYKPEEFKPVLCGGGFGLPPLFLLAKRLIEAGVPSENIKAVSAGRTEEDLLFEKYFQEAGVHYTGAAETLNEGSLEVKADKRRIKGTAAHALDSYSAAGESEINFLYASGPDLMMRSLLPSLSDQVEYQFLFERYMKCAIGICGSCVVDPSGIRICKEGPALMRTQVEQLEDFGVYRRRASGAVDYFKNRLSEQESNTIETSGAKNL